ncbi:type I restriction endonuclease [Parvibium lacunae]|uniref:Type I restriction endonuclease subunit R n=1 Tax=Parvibium lacunae TaxID=1888893 RepID=A0A368L7Z6_9BURK|nr:type I restriction endonuclease [Parvibium lacunae]RCS59737.1 type I restriction endonuclease subunit R [Parvibium lacunae]
MNEFLQRVTKHIEHVTSVGEHCTTEETTKQALILPLLDILGFNPYDPTKVKAEHAADFPGAKAGERVDYALFCNGKPVMFIEAKPFSSNLNNHCPQLSRYYNATPDVTVGAITNGREWRFFTDLVNKNIMDSEPFLTVRFDQGQTEAALQLNQFHHDKFQPEALRAMAEENTYLSAFKNAITHILSECDTDFVKYMAARAGIQRTFTARFIETVQPIMKQAVVKAISDMVTTSLTKPSQADISANETAPPPPPAFDPDAPTIDPNNSKIVTTSAEKRLLEISTDILPNEPLVAKDTESYFSVLYEGKANRWLVRYWANKKRPTLNFCMPLTEQHRLEIKRAKIEMMGSDSLVLDKPDLLSRIPGLLDDALAFCKNDENFKRAQAQDKQPE